MWIDTPFCKRGFMPQRQEFNPLWSDAQRKQCGEFVGRIVSATLISETVNRDEYELRYEDGRRIRVAIQHLA